MSCTAAKSTAAFSGLLLVVLAVAACTTPSADPAASASAATASGSTAESSPSATAGAATETPAGCTDIAVITTPWHETGSDDPVELQGELVDMGPKEYASGTVGYNTDGEIETYTVAAGDTMEGIAQRFCVDSVTVAVYNHAWDTYPNIQPGDVFILRPDPTEPWTE